MPKQITDSEIYIAPKILGVIKENKYIVTDEESNSELDIDNIDDKIFIYERQVKAWFLDRAKELLNSDDNQFIILMICVTYFEGVQQYIDGKNSNKASKIFFVRSVKRIFPSLIDKDLEDLYSDARCGLFHSGMVKKKTILSNDFPEAIDFSVTDRIKVNPRKLLEEIIIDFDKYLIDLRDSNNVDLRKNFNFLYTFN